MRFIVEYMTTNGLTGEVAVVADNKRDAVKRVTEMYRSRISEKDIMGVRVDMPHGLEPPSDIPPQNGVTTTEDGTTVDYSPKVSDALPGKVHDFDMKTAFANLSVHVAELLRVNKDMYAQLRRISDNQEALFRLFQKATQS